MYASSKKHPSISRREHTKSHVLRTAATLFADQGADATTIDEIVTAAGVAKGTFYNYFEDRAAIEEAIAKKIRKKLTASVKHANATINDPAERVVRGVKLYLSLAYIDPVSARILTRLHGNDTINNRPLDRSLLADLSAGISEGRFAVPNVDIALHLVLGLSVAGMRYLLATGADEEILNGGGYAQEAARVLLQGLGVKSREIERILARPFSVESAMLQW